MAVPHLDEGIVSEILHRLPTKEAYRVAAVCRRWRGVLSEPTFLCRHLCVRPLLPDERPFAFIVQPKGKVRYTHVTVVPTDPGDAVRLNLPLARRYMDNPPPLPRQSPPALLDDTAAGKSVLHLLYREDDPVGPPELLDTACGEDGDDALFRFVFPRDGPDDFVPVPEEETMVEADRDRVPPGGNDYVFFFEQTVPTLNISIVASHGRLLLGRSRTGFYVCNPAANRWLALPPSTTVPGLETNSGIHYDILDGASSTAFTVVLLARRRRRRVLVETFSSTTGRWDARELAAPGAARRLGAASPGIHVGSCFYWLAQDRRLDARWVPGGILRYDAARGRVSVLREPPEPEQSKARVGRSLGSAGGRLRMCAFDIVRDDHETSLPHDGLEGAHGVWTMTAEEHGDGERMAGNQWRWRRVHEAVVGDISTWYFNMLFDHEKPVDFAGACGDFIVVEKEMFLLRYDLESGTKVELCSLYRSSGNLGHLYRRFHAFAFFR